MIKAKFFEFSSYRIDLKKRTIFFKYKIFFSNQNLLSFTEKIIFPKNFSIKKIPQELLKNVLIGTHLILGISYYKLYCPPKFKLKYSLSKEQAEFWNTIYRKGLGEFFFRNKLDPKILARFPRNKKEVHTSLPIKRKNRSLVGIGGGKDSIVTAELLKSRGIDINAFLIETQKSHEISRNAIKQMKIPSLIIKRMLDEKIFQKHADSYNGHIPISAVFAFLGYLTALLYDYSYVVVGNEFSSNFGNAIYKGEEINHQWSKSVEFENFFQNYGRKYLSPSITYFSLLRPFSELRIAELFSRYKKYFPYFSSCNRNFKIQGEKSKTLWCGQCAKCAFAFAILSPFLEKKKLIRIFNKNLYEDKNLLPIFADILGFGKMKPFDCVGTFEETRASLYLSRINFADSFIVKKFASKIKNIEVLTRNALKTNPSPALPANLKFLGIKNVAILGYGKEGKITEQYIKKYFPEIKISVLDKNTDKNYLQKQTSYDLLVKTPGIPKKFVKIPYTTATNIFFSAVKNRNIIIGITGSKGKSTTVSLIYSILKKAGKNAQLLGNIGNPMLAALLKPVNPDKIFIAELSSYQLDDIDYSPDIAVILNLFPEHMNYHGNIENYYLAKKNIINFQNKEDVFIGSKRNPRVKKWLQESQVKIVDYSNVPIKKYKTSLLGSHNGENIKVAATVANLFKIPEKTIKEAIKEFSGLPHRLEYLGNFKGINFYDDAISTTPESTIMALKSLLKTKTIFLGGEDRGYDFTQLEKTLVKNKIKNIVLFPKSGKRILKSAQGFNILKTRSMEEAVKFAYRHTPKGTICLLSTASPSYGLWKNFEEKGAQFKYFVQEQELAK